MEKTRNSQHRGDNAMMRIIRELDRQMFPGGTADEQRQVADLLTLLRGKHPEKTIRNTLRFALSQMLLIQPDRSRVVESIVSRPNNKLSKSEAEELCHYAIAHNERLRQLYSARE